MTPRAAWRMLDIEPTADRRAVKRAYAAKLKAIDPDRDIQLFLKLRDALAAAEAAATRLAAQAARVAELGDPDEDEADEDETDVDGGGDGVRFDWRGGDGLGNPSGLTITVGGAGAAPSFADPPPLSPPPPPPPPAPAVSRRKNPVEPAPSPSPAPSRPAPQPPEIADPEPVAVDPRDLVAAALFVRRGDRDQRHLVEAVEALLADDRMDGVGYAAETEEWLAHVLAQAGEAADPVIPIVARHFNWAAELNVARQRPMIARVAVRANDLHCADMLRDPRHHWHEAFALLQRPAPRRVDFYSRTRFGTQVAELIESLRYHHPAVETLLDADHVALWTAAVPPPSHRPTPFGVAGISWYGWLIILWLAVLAARLILWAVS